MNAKEKVRPARQQIRNVSCANWVAHHYYYWNNL